MQSAQKTEIQQNIAGTVYIFCNKSKFTLAKLWTAKVSVKYSDWIVENKIKYLHIILLLVYNFWYFYICCRTCKQKPISLQMKETMKWLRWILQKWMMSWRCMQTTVPAIAWGPQITQRNLPLMLYSLGMFFYDTKILLKFLKKKLSFWSS